MSAETFFARWSRRKGETAVVAEPGADDVGAVRIAGAPPAAVADAAVQPPPTLEDVASLTKDSDFTPFVARGVDETVRRSAMKKLFTDPHFNIMDGLDIYIDDYSKFEPIPPEMLAQLNHAKDLLNPLAMLDRVSPRPPPPLPQPQAMALAEAAAGTEAAGDNAHEHEHNIDATPDSLPDSSPAAPIDATPVPEPHDDSIQSL